MVEPASLYALRIHSRGLMRGHPAALNAGVRTLYDAGIAVRAGADFLHGRSPEALAKTLEDHAVSRIVTGQTLLHLSNWKSAEPRLEGEIDLVSLNDDGGVTLEKVKTVFVKPDPLQLSQMGEDLAGRGKAIEGAQLSLRAAEIYAERGDIVNQAYRLSHAGDMLIRGKEYRRGTQAKLGAADLFCELGKRARDAQTVLRRKNEEAFARSYAGKAFYEAGEKLRAAHLKVEAARLFFKLGDMKNYFSDMFFGAKAFEKTGEHEEAVKIWLELARVSQKQGDKRSEAKNIERAAAALARSGKFREAAELGVQAAFIFDEMGDKKRKAIDLSLAGDYLFEEGMIDEGMQLKIRAAEVFASEAGDLMSAARTLSFAGDALFRAGFIQEGSDLRLKASELFMMAGNREQAAREKDYVGDLLIERGMHELGRRLKHEATQMLARTEV